MTDGDEEFGPCIDCGRQQTRNPHPHAGEPGHPEAGYTWICVPCLVENRHRWAARARRAEAQVASTRTEGLRAAREVVERQTDLTELVHFERPSDFRKGVITCLAALDNAIREAEASV